MSSCWKCQKMFILLNMWMSGARKGVHEAKVSRTVIWRARPWGLNLNCSSMLMSPLMPSHINYDRRRWWLESRALANILVMRMKRHCLLISRNIKEPLKEELVTDWELDYPLILEFGALSNPGVLQMRVLLTKKSVMKCHSPFKMVKAQIQGPALQWSPILIDISWTKHVFTNHLPLIPVMRDMTA